MSSPHNEVRFTGTFSSTRADLISMLIFTDPNKRIKWKCALKTLDLVLLAKSTQGYAGADLFDMVGKAGDISVMKIAYQRVINPKSSDFEHMQRTLIDKDVAGEATAFIHIKVTSPTQKDRDDGDGVWVGNRILNQVLKTITKAKWKIAVSKGILKLMQASLGICISLKASNHVIRWEDVPESSGTKHGAGGDHHFEKNPIRLATVAAAHSLVNLGAAFSPSRFFAAPCRYASSHPSIAP
uniref:Uncharacterized protein n=1 Tax=Salix viminalis TaxID=40686 RepID=A0A6N2M005_SALVM